MMLEKKQHISRLANSVHIQFSFSTRTKKLAPTEYHFYYLYQHILLTVGRTKLAKRCGLIPRHKLLGFMNRYFFLRDLLPLCSLDNSLR